MVDLLANPPNRQTARQRSFPACRRHRRSRRLPRNSRLRPPSSPKPPSPKPCPSHRSSQSRPPPRASPAANSMPPSSPSKASSRAVKPLPSPRLPDPVRPHHLSRPSCPSSGDQSLRLSSGSRVRVTGVCQWSRPPTPSWASAPPNSRLRLRNASDLTLLECPPGFPSAVPSSWLAPCSSASSPPSSGFASSIAKSTSAPASLSRKSPSTERAEIFSRAKPSCSSRKLSSANASRPKSRTSHKQLLTTSPHGRYGDVATNVLHNVGNVLNSVNVLAASIAGHVQKSRVASVSKVAAPPRPAPIRSRPLHDRRPQRPPRPRPPRTPRAPTSPTSKTASWRKSNPLSESIAHIKEIVAMQQNYAKVSGLRETVAIAISSKTPSACAAAPLPATNQRHPRLRGNPTPHPRPPQNPANPFQPA